MHACMYVCMYVCIYVYAADTCIYIYADMYIGRGTYIYIFVTYTYICICMCVYTSSRKHRTRIYPRRCQPERTTLIRLCWALYGITRAALNMFFVFQTMSR